MSTKKRVLSVSTECSLPPFNLDNRYSSGRRHRRSERVRFVEEERIDRDL